VNSLICGGPNVRLPFWYKAVAPGTNATLGENIVLTDLGVRNLPPAKLHRAGLRESSFVITSPLKLPAERNHADVTNLARGATPASGNHARIPVHWKG
jgi:hypothetical protein